MKLSAPSKICFLISLIIFIIAVLGAFGVVGAVAGYATWAFIGAWVVLALGCLMTGF